MTAKTPTERKRDLIARRKAAGLKELRNCWVHPADEPSVREYAARLTRRRERAKKETT